MKDAVEAEAGTTEEAIEIALDELGADRDRVSIEVLEEPNKGLLGLRKVKAKVRVTIVDNETEARVVIEEMLLNLGVEATIETRFENGILWMKLTGESLSWLIGHHGQTLDAIQVLVSSIVGRRLKKSARLIVDIEGYREKRQKEVKSMAERTVGQVLGKDEAISLSPMTALERKLVHLVVGEYAGASSVSMGDEPNRFVIISPVQEGQDT